MKKIIFFLLFICLTSPAFAIDTEDYIVEKPDGSVAIARYIPSSTDSLEKFLSGSGLGGLPFTRLQNPEVLKDKTDRKYWARSGKRIVIDTVNKQDDLALKAQKESRKNELLSKLGISESELKELVS